MIACTIATAARKDRAGGDHPDHLVLGEDRLTLQSRLRLLLRLSPCGSELAVNAPALIGG